MSSYIKLVNPGDALVWLCRVTQQAAPAGDSASAWTELAAQKIEYCEEANVE